MIIRLNSGIKNRNNFLAWAIFIIQNIGTNSVIYVDSGGLKNWFNSLGIRFWKFCKIFENAWVASICTRFSGSFFWIFYIVIRNHIFQNQLHAYTCWLEIMLKEILHCKIKTNDISENSRFSAWAQNSLWSSNKVLVVSEKVKFVIGQCGHYS